jgi:membrane-associated phospholipid phosphatase
LKSFTRQNKFFFALYSIFLLAGAVLITTMERGNEILYFNSLHTPFLNSFFYYVTKLAEAPLFILSLVVAIRFSYGKGMILSLNALLVFAVTGILKHLVFDSQVRPSVFFEGRAELHFVQGLEVLRYNSFPSGHTAGAFGFFCMLSLLFKDKRWSILFFAAALLVGVSRVYLLQHFFRDVYAGSMVGVGVATFFYLTFVRSGFYNSLHWKDKALLKW